MPRIQKTGSTASTSMYFKSFPEIRQRNNLPRKTKKPVVLPNVSISPAVKINGVSYFIHNTCPLDSIIHILMTSAIDDPPYAAFIAKSSNNTMKGRSGISMIWVLPLGFDPYCEGKWLSEKYKMNLHRVSTGKIFFTKVIKEFCKIKKSNFFENGSTDLDG